MKRPARLVLALLAPFVLAWSIAADAQNCAAGKIAYNKTSASVPTACSNSSCHGANVNLHSIQNAAGNPSLINEALDGTNPDIANAEMTNLDIRNNLPLSETEIIDIAEYIFQFGATGKCPAASPVVGASPTSAAFGNVNVGSSSSTQTITISNTGAGGATGMSYPVAPAQFSKSGTCANGALAAGASCTVIFTFSPTAAGSFSPTYTITGNGGISVPISLSGTGVAASAPNIQVSPTSLSFGTVNVGQTAAAQTITVTNSGNASATNMAYPAAPAKFTKGGTCASATLAASASCTVTFTYTPTAAGPDNATYTISGGGSSTPVSLSGTGAAAQPASLHASPPTLAFGSVSVGTTSGTQSVTINNSGGSAATGVSVASGNPARFVLSGNTCGGTLAAGASCAVNVAYAPSAATTDNATLTITYTGGSAVTVAMSGTGTAAAVAALGASPASLSFGTVTVGATSGTKSVTLTNTGGAAATGVAFANSNASEFVVSGNTCGATVAAGASCALNVAYAPSGTGADTASLTISSTGGANIVIALSGTGSAAPTASLTAAPPVLAFGNVNVGATSAGIGVTITNSGGAAATGIAFVNSNSTEFVVSGNTCSATIAAGASCALSVAYSPSAGGADSATITVNYAGGGALSISLSGTGIAGTPPPGGQLSMTTSVTMPDTTIGTSSAAHTVTVSNIGGAAVTVTAITSSNAGEFPVSSSTCATVNAGASCTFNIGFAPSGLGGRAATITIASNGTGSPQSIVVSGTGLSASGPPPTPVTATAVEYYHQVFDHYFITSITDEITKLDNGTFVGWARTGKSFKVYQAAGDGLNVVCRFFSTSFNPKSSHFYTPFANECTIVKASPDWAFEGEVFFVAVPALDGSCAAGTVPVYRMYNMGQGAAPNHRYTTDLAVRTAMLAQGWQPEGYGNIGVIMCAPP